jgi:hypothetical protein
VNYIDTIAEKIGLRCDMSMAEPSQRRLLRIYALLALTTGGDTTSENVHDAWSAWRAGTMPDHKSLIPFEQLDKATQDMDNDYRDAILVTVDEIEGYHE